MKIKKVSVLGCGLMGSGITEVVSRAGYEVTILEVTDEALEAGRRRVARSLDRAEEREKVTSEERRSALDRMQWTTSVTEAADCDVVLEAVVESLDAKTAAFVELDRLCPEHTIFASNTSSIPIADLAASVSRSDRVLGLHFFNPVPVMGLVEVVRSLATSDRTFQRALSFSRSLGKEPIVARDRAGFVVNLLLVPYLLDAVRQLEGRVATMEDLDRAMVLGCGHPMGPFTLLDLVGIDTTVRIADVMFDEYRSDRYAAPPLLRRMAALGRHGRKTGRGFYDYSGETPVPLET